MWRHCCGSPPAWRRCATAAGRSPSRRAYTEPGRPAQGTARGAEESARRRTCCCPHRAWAALAHSPRSVASRPVLARLPAPERRAVSEAALSPPCRQGPHPGPAPACLCDEHDEHGGDAAAGLAGEVERPQLLRCAESGQGEPLGAAPCGRRERRPRACNSPRTPASSRLSRAAASATVSSVSQPPCVGAGDPESTDTHAGHVSACPGAWAGNAVLARQAHGCRAGLRPRRQAGGARPRRWRPRLYEWPPATALRSQRARLWEDEALAPATGHHEHLQLALHVLPYRDAPARPGPVSALLAKGGVPPASRPPHSPTHPATSLAPVAS